MTKVLVRSCPLCGHGDGEIVHSQRFAAPDELPVEDTVDVVACAQCGLVFSDVVTRQDVFDEVYKDHSKYIEVEAAPWDLDRLRDTAAYLADRLSDRSARILDAGCATGSLLSFLSGEGFTNLVGLDPSAAATETARRRVDAEVITGSFFVPPVDIGTFDVVALSHVLEHLADVGPAVAALAALLHTGGMAYIEVPDAPHYVDHLVAPFHDFNTEHINHFSLPLLRRIMDEHGFVEVESGEKVVMCSPVHTYPAIFGLWRRTADHQSADDLEPDTELLASINRYVAESSALLDQIDRDLEDALGADESVIVWGAGQLAMKLMKDTVLATKHVSAVVDGSPAKQGLHIDGSPVVAPSAVGDAAEPIVVTSIHHQASIADAIRVSAPSARVVFLSAERP